MFAPVMQFTPAYRLPWNGIPSGSGVGALFNDYLITPPRIYGESYAGVGPWSLFARRGSGTGTDGDIVLLFYADMIYWPSWEIRMASFNGADGSQKSASAAPWGAVEAEWTGDVVQGFDGSIWRTLLQDIQELSIDLGTVLQTVTAAHFGIVQCRLPAVNKALDFVVMADQADAPILNVYTLSTGALQRAINISDHPACIAPEAGTRVYVLGINNILNLVDTATGVIHGTWRCPTPADATKVLIGWDDVYHRLLVFGWTPDAADGASTSTITAYHPLPIPTQIMHPVPLAVPRKGRIVNMLSRLSGDVGEPVAGQRAVSGSATDDAAFTGYALSQVQDTGYVRLPLSCVDEGSSDVTVTVTV